MLGTLFRRIWFWLSGQANADAIQEEMRLHVELRAEKLREGGQLANEASVEASRRFGNQLHLRERSQDMWITPSISDLARDFRIAARTLRRYPGFAVTAALTLAIGIGATTAVFSVVNSVLLRPLAYPEADRVVTVSLKAPGAQGITTASGNLMLSASMYFTFAEQNQTLDAMGVWTPGTATVTNQADPEQVRTVLLTNGTFRALRVNPLYGRGFTAVDDDLASASTVILSHGYWQRRFGGDPLAVGRTLLVNGTVREIVGIMPRGFRVADTDADLLFSLRFKRSELKLPGFGLQAIGRLRPGVELAAANADINRLIPVWMTSWPMVPGVDPKVYNNWKLAADLRPLKEQVVGNVQEVLWVVMATIAMVLLIATANVASLLLVRVEARRPELATRSALGASSVRIFREILVESTLLGLIGGAIGLPAAVVAVRALVAAGPAMLPRLHEISSDMRAGIVALSFAVAAGLFAGAIPAWKYGRGSVFNAIRSSGRTASGSRERGWTRNALVIAQVSMAVVLLVGAGLMIRTFQAMRNTDPGFTHADQIQTARVMLPGPADKLTRGQMDILQRLETTPGVESAAFTSEVPMDGIPRNWDAVCQEGKGVQTGEIPPIRTFKAISPGYFRTMGARILAGRDLTWTDIQNRLPLVLISENLAREFYGGPQAALGKRLGSCVPKTAMREVIGVVQDVHDDGMGKPATSIVYWPPVVVGMYEPNDFNATRNITLTVRSRTAGTEGMLNHLNQAVWAVNKGIAVAVPRTMQQVLDQSMARTSFTMVMLGIAGSMALLLGFVGIYGVISYAVTQRRREMGIRLALGERPGAIQARFVSQSLLLAGTGIAVGLVASSVLMRLMQGLLYATSPQDPLTYALVLLVLCFSAGVASLVPARRAAQLDPVETLRSDG